VPNLRNFTQPDRKQQANTMQRSLHFCDFIVIVRFYQPSHQAAYGGMPNAA
jgi:hypothetical protein